jgi:hypothetical protein
MISNLAQSSTAIASGDDSAPPSILKKDVGLFRLEISHLVNVEDK